MGVFLSVLRISWEAWCSKNIVSISTKCMLSNTYFTPSCFSRAGFGNHLGSCCLVLGPNVESFPGSLEQHWCVLYACSIFFTQFSGLNLVGWNLQTSIWCEWVCKTTFPRCYDCDILWINFHDFWCLGNRLRLHRFSWLSCWGRDPKNTCIEAIRILAGSLTSLYQYSVPRCYKHRIRSAEDDKQDGLF